MTDLFEALGAESGGEAPVAPPRDEAETGPGSGSAGDADLLAEVAADPGAEAASQEAQEETGQDEQPAPGNGTAAAQRPEQANVVEEDPYDFDRCLITVAMAMMPEDGSPDGRTVMLGVRNHQDEPIMIKCRLNDLRPLPDPIQQLLEQLKEQLPARSEKAAQRRAKAAESRKKGAAARAAPAARAKKAGKAQPASLNLFEMFDQPSQPEASQ